VPLPSLPSKDVTKTRIPSTPHSGLILDTTRAKTSASNDAVAMAAPTAATEPLKSRSDLDEPGGDFSFLLTPPVTVYLATINLRGSEAVSGTRWTSFLRPLLSNRSRLVKRWAIIIRDTLYELRVARENRSMVVLRTTHWPSVRDRHDTPIPIGTTTLSDAEILAISELPVIPC